MNLTFRLTLSFLIVINFAGLTRAHDERLNGRTVEVQARVVAVNADGQSLELYDSPSRTRISVQLAQLPKAERKALIRSDVREVLVRGQVSMVAGRLTIHAESVQWNDKETSK
jgi:hypothetical protein